MLKLLESNDFLAVKLDPPKAVSEGGIFLTEAEAILNNEKVGRVGTVYAAPARYTLTRNRGDKSIPILVDSPVKAGEPSDPYLMTGYDRKSVSLTSKDAATIQLEIDVDGTGLWIPYRSFTLTAGTLLTHDFPEGFSAYWVRASSNVDSTATVTFRYE